MKTLIIAAGDGTRLMEYTRDNPKPLIPLYGKSILETILEKCGNEGLKNFVIVTGYLGEKIKKVVNKNNMNVEFVDNPKFNRENGYSVYCAKNILKDENKFLLLMSDHIFGSNFLKKMIKYRIEEGCALCIDKNLKNIFDLQEATKVYERNGKILNIGKQLKNYNAVDTGFFLCTPDIFKALEKSIQQGLDKLSDSMKLLAKHKKLFSIDITGKFWLDIDTEKDLKYARSCGRRENENDFYFL